MSVSIFKATGIFLLLIAFSAAGQTKSVSKKDTLVNWRPTGIRIGTDLAAAIKTGVSSGFSNQELFADIGFHRYYLVTEMGRYSRELEIDKGNYSNNGGYLRIGADVNFLVKDPDKNLFFLGFRYGRARYDERVQYLTATDYGEQLKIAENNNVSSGWLELTTGLRVKVWKLLWVGYTGRIKFAPSTPSNSPIAPYDIPGYGLTFKKPWWGFSYYVMFKIPFGKN